MADLVNSDGKKRIEWVGLLFLLAVSAGWGFNWVVMKNLIAEWPPLSSRGLAGIVGALGLMLAAKVSGERLKVAEGEWPRLLLAAFLNVTGWMGVGGLALLWLSAGESVIVAYTMPAWAALFAWLILGERFTLLRALALILGIAGVVILFSGHLFSGREMSFGLTKWLGLASVLFPAIGFALGAVLMKRTPISLPPIASAAWQIGLGSIPTVIVGFLWEQPQFASLTWVGWLSLLWFAVITLGACYLFWFAALRRLPAGVAAIGTFLVPVIGVLAGGFVLGEQLTWRELVALACTASGILLAARGAQKN